MTFDNLNIVLTNAVCCSAVKAVELSDLLSKGNLCVESKIRELKLLNDRINLLRCYNFDTSTQLATFTVSVTNIEVFASTVFTLNINNIAGPSVVYNVFNNINSVYTYLFTKAGFTYILISSIGNVKTYLVTALCDTNTLTVSNSNDSSINTFIQNTKGSCTIKTNCITEDQMNSITNEIMEYCNICNCQLKQ